jgi:DNA-binding transcriptional LysR family regulator
MPSWTTVNGGEKVNVKAGSRFRMNSASMIRQMAILGMGVAFLPEPIVADDLAADSLDRVLPAWQGEPQSIDALTETRLVSTTTRPFIEFVRDKLRDL